MLYEEMPEVSGHEVHLTQLFQNLIANAVKYRREAPPEIHVDASQDGPDYVFSVKDNGVGIDPDQFQRIFGAFQRLHGREIPGAGIGLATCRKIVEQYGGRMWVESEPGQGSTFFFTLPRPSDSDADDNATRRRAASARVD